MATAQIQLYPATEAPDPLDPETTPDDLAAWAENTRWGWRKWVGVEPPESYADTGLVFENRQAAFDDAQARCPNWPIG